jgi:hypothetical protein
MRDEEKDEVKRCKKPNIRRCAKLGGGKLKEKKSTCRYNA